MKPVSTLMGVGHRPAVDELEARGFDQLGSVVGKLDWFNLM